MKFIKVFSKTTAEGSSSSCSQEYIGLTDLPSEVIHVIVDHLPVVPDFINLSEANSFLFYVVSDSPAYKSAKLYFLFKELNKIEKNKVLYHSLPRLLRKQIVAIKTDPQKILLSERIIKLDNLLNKIVSRKIMKEKTMSNILCPSSGQPFQLEAMGLQRLPSNVLLRTEFEKLFKLVLRHNELKEIPEALTKLARLEILDVSHNKLVVVPKGILNHSRFSELNLSHNNLRSLPAVSIRRHSPYLLLSYNSLKKEHLAPIKPLLLESFNKTLQSQKMFSLKKQSIFKRLRSFSV